ncbi:MFS transporter [Candidatus Woesearchaeota archaeon]|nr:MAG: MFS transporter [Candidatus Woesearchaeota archaeon]
MHNHHFFSFLKNRELDELYLSIAIRSFALSMISVFIPLYLLSLDYGLNKVFYFYIVMEVFWIISVFPAAKLASRFGFKHSILFSVPLLIVGYVLLFSLKAFPKSFFIIPALLGINFAMFWIGYHVDFAKFSKKGKRGKEVGASKILSSVFSSAGPIIGGLILSLIGFKSLFVIVSFLLLASTAPLFFSRDIHEPLTVSFKKLFKSHRIKDFLGFSAWGFEFGVEAIIWPVIIFLLITKNYVSLGVFKSITLFATMLVVFLVSKISDKHQKFLLRAGSVFLFAIWIARSFIKTTTGVIGTNAVYGLVKPSQSIPFEMISYDKANSEGIVLTIVFREVSIHLGRITLFIILALTENIILGFFMAMAGSLMYLFL